MKLFWLIIALIVMGSIFDHTAFFMALGLIVLVVYKMFQNFKRNKDKREVLEMTMKIEEFFSNHDKLKLSEEISLKMIEPLMDDYRQLGVYLNDEYVAKLIDFKNYTEYEDCFEKMNRHLDKAMLDGVIVDENNNGIDDRDEKEGASYFLSRLYHEKQRFSEVEICNGIHEIEQLLTKIQDFETRYPQIQPRLRKLYQHYLPMMLSILDQYKSLKDKSTSVDEVNMMRVKLEKTLFLVQEALKTLIATFVQDDVLNMNSDMSVLETILKRDGLVDDGLRKEGVGHE